MRFDIRAEREEYERLFAHQARVLQDRLAPRGHTDRTRKHAITEWEKNLQAEMRELKLLHQARVLSWGKEKIYYFGRDILRDATRIFAAECPTTDCTRVRRLPSRWRSPQRLKLLSEHPG